MSLLPAPTSTIILLIGLLFLSILLVILKINKSQRYINDLQEKLDLLKIKDSEKMIESKFLFAQQEQLIASQLEHIQNTIHQIFNGLHDNLYQQKTQTQEQQNRYFIQLQQLISNQLTQQSQTIEANIVKLNTTTEARLKELGQQLDLRLNQTFNQTQTTFVDIQKRLSIIDEAQKRIDFLSENVVSLQNVLTDKKTRGVFGELQLQTIIENALPKQFVSFQYTLSNQCRADCVIHLPKPSGNFVIDSKFPLESYRKLVDSNHQTKKAMSQVFKQHIKKHINDIANKYILPPETTDSAIMFIPAEMIFAEIQAYHYDLVEFAQKRSVWLTSPTTLMAVLTMAKSIIKDDATRKQAKVLREQLFALKQDFDRFQTRMDNLSRHIEQANNDVRDVATSAGKISKHFTKIEATEEWDVAASTNK